MYKYIMWANNTLLSFTLLEIVMLLTKSQVLDRIDGLVKKYYTIARGIQNTHLVELDYCPSEKIFRVYCEAECTETRDIDEAIRKFNSGE